MSKTTLSILEINTPLGLIISVASSAGICYLEFIKGILNDEFKLKIETQLNASLTADPNKHIQLLKTELLAYFKGTLKQFTVALDMLGTDFQKQVWTELQTIPYGETRSYEQQALNFGDLKAIRAVASANGKNKIAIVIPCHRVIGKNGSLTGYAGGLDKKKWLLDFESKNSGNSYQTSLEL